MLQAAVARQREFLRRRVGGEVHAHGRRPRRRAAQDRRPGAARPRRARPASLAHLWVAESRGGGLLGWRRWLATHPPMAERLRRLYGRSVDVLDAPLLPPPGRGRRAAARLRARRAAHRRPPQAPRRRSSRRPTRCDAGRAARSAGRARRAAPAPPTGTAAANARRRCWRWLIADDGDAAPWPAWQRTGRHRAVRRTGCAPTGRRSAPPRAGRSSTRSSHARATAAPPIVRALVRAARAPRAAAARRACGGCCSCGRSRNARHRLPWRRRRSKRSRQPFAAGDAPCSRARSGPTPARTGPRRAGARSAPAPLRTAPRAAPPARDAAPARRARLGRCAPLRTGLLRDHAAAAGVLIAACRLLDTPPPAALLGPPDQPRIL